MTDPFGMLQFPEPPSEADLDPLLASEGAQKVAQRNASIVSPDITPRDRLIVGARVVAGNQGSARDAYDLWRQDRTQPSPPRAGTSPKQAAVLAAPDDLSRGKVLGKGAAAWLELTGADPIDVARFDQAPKVGRAAELWDKMLAGGLESDDEAFTLAERVGRVGRELDDFDDDLTVGGGKVVEVGDRVRVHWSAEPAPGVVTALPLNSLPSDVFDGDVDDGFDTYVGDDIAVAAPVESQAMLRRAFPAASTGKTPRWLSVRPASVVSLSDAVESAGFDPAANVAVHFDSHPGLAPYDSITFSTADDKRATRFTELGAQRLERGINSRARYARRTVTSDDLVDAATAEKLTDSTAWAVFPDGVDHPDAIPMKSGGAIVFGIDPEDASELASTFAYVNDGIAIEPGYDGLEPFDTDPVWFELELRDGTSFTFPGSAEEALLTSEREKRAVQRWQIPVSEGVKVDGLVAHLEMLGAEDVAAYVTGGVDGMVEAREVLWGDGTGKVASSRVAGARSGPNRIPVWVRDVAGLPDDSEVDAALYDVSSALAQAEVDGDTWRVDASGVDDVAEAVRAGHELGLRYGYENVEVVGRDGLLELVR